MTAPPAPAATPAKVKGITLDFDELQGSLLSPLISAVDEIERFATSFRNVTGEFDSSLWEARLHEPPTLSDIGSMFVFCDWLKAITEGLRTNLDSIEGRVHLLDTMRFEKQTRLDDGSASESIDLG